WLQGEARAEWNRVARHLQAGGLLAKADRGLLAAYCDAWGEFVDLATRVEADPDAWRLRAAKHRAAERLARLGAQFGLSPSARGRVEPLPAPRDPRKAKYFNDDNGPDLDDFRSG